MTRVNFYFRRITKKKKFFWPFSILLSNIYAVEGDTAIIMIWKHKHEKVNVFFLWECTNHDPKISDLMQIKSSALMTIAIKSSMYTWPSLTVYAAMCRQLMSVIMSLIHDSFFFINTICFHPFHLFLKLSFYFVNKADNVSSVHRRVFRNSKRESSSETALYVHIS